MGRKDEGIGSSIAAGAAGELAKMAVNKIAKKFRNRNKRPAPEQPSNELNVTEARLALAERILSELYSGTGRAVKKDMVKTVDKKIRKQLDKPAKMGKETARVQSNIDALYKRRRKLKPEDAGYDPLP
tara:strand:+ start:190 stop:573 length:384 start_codon:yes stop_codon:yes gene_type:complete